MLRTAGGILAGCVTARAEVGIVDVTIQEPLVRFAMDAVTEMREGCAFGSWRKFDHSLARRATISPPDSAGS